MAYNADTIGTVDKHNGCVTLPGRPESVRLLNRPAPVDRPFGGISPINRFIDDSSSASSSGFNIDLRDTHSNIIARSGDAVGTIAFATDTYDLYVFDGANWYFYDYNSTTAFSSTLSASFDGTDDYLLMGTSAISLDTNFTISAWIRPTSAALAGYDFIGGWGNAASGQTRAMQILNSKLSFEIYFSRVSGSTDLSADTWHHAAITFSGNNVEIFLNGSSDGTGSLSRSTMTASETFIGGTSTMKSEGFVPFAGLIDEFAVFDSVLSASNITDIYNSGVPADLTSYSPVGWWRMGENDSGSDGATIGTVTDQGSGGNNGTGTNGPTYSNSVPS